MKKITLVSCAALLLASLSVLRAQTPATIVNWNFENLAIASFVPNPQPSTNNSVGAVAVSAFGMDIYNTPALGTNDPDVLLGAAGDTGVNTISNLTHTWRIRGQKAGNGWSSQAPVGTQGGSFSADTTGYTNIQVAFDWYATTQGEANLALQYTIDGLTWTNLSIVIPAGGDAGLAFVDNSGGGDANSMSSFYVSDNFKNNSQGGQDWFTNLTATVTNVLAANNPHFGIRLVNASTGASCVAAAGTALNNTSGNWRFDNIYIIGVATGAALVSPVVTPSPNATVDGLFTNTFTENPNWRTNIGSIQVNGNLLPTSVYTISPGQIVFNPANSAFLQTSGTVTFSIAATNYSADLVSQPISSGLPKSLHVSLEPNGPTANGGTLVQQVKLAMFDQYNNVSTNGTATYLAQASAGWTFGAHSTLIQPLANGLVTFTNLSAVSPATVPNATITFTALSSSGLGGLPFTTTNSTPFLIPGPQNVTFAPGYLAVEQEDLVNNNSTFSILQLNPTTANQVAPAAIFPVPATYTNGLRQSSSGSTGDLSDSQDGTLLCFTAALWQDSTLSDSTTVDPRGCGTFDFQGNYTLQASYVGLGDGTANQTRSATTLDDTTFWMGDKGGVYTNGETPLNAYIAFTAGNGNNIRELKAFGGVLYAMQQEGSTDPSAVVLNSITLPGSGNQTVEAMEGFPIDGSVLDFYLTRSGNNGAAYDTCYFIDGTNNTHGAIFKYYFTGNFDQNLGGIPVWANAGSTLGTGNGGWTTTNGGCNLCVATNVNGTVDLYYTTGSGGTAGNSVVHVVDSGAWNQPINLISTNVLYTVAGQSTLKGIAFAPLPAPGNVQTYPVGGLTNVTYSAVGPNPTVSFKFSSPAGAGVSSSFAVWGSTNLTTPLSQWKYLGHPTDTGLGVYSFTDTSGTTNALEFYQVTSP